MEYGPNQWEPTADERPGEARADENKPETRWNVNNWAVKVTIEIIVARDSKINGARFSGRV
jgi:hypothetical protein